MSRALAAVALVALAAVALAGCSSPTCGGAAPTVTLREGYCTAGEADRCYFDHDPADGF